MGGGGGGDAGGDAAALPWVMVPGEEDGEEKIFLTVEEHYPREALLKAIPELLRSGGELWPPCYGWLPVSPSSSSATTAPPFLFNLATCSSSDIIHLPSLQTLPNNNRSEILWFLLSSPPTDPECRVFLVHNVNLDPRSLSYTEISYCKPGDQLWTVHATREDLNRIDPEDHGVPEMPKLFSLLCSFQGKLYAKAFKFPYTLVISVDTVTNRLDLSSLKVNYDGDRMNWPALVRVRTWMGESMGELLQVCAYFYGAPCQTYSIRVFKFDFAKNMWMRMCSLKDRTLFLSYSSSISSCPTASKPRIRACDDIFFFRPDDERLHSFNLEQDSFSFYLPDNTLTSPSHSPTLVMSLPRSRDADESYSKNELDTRAEGCVVNWEALLDNNCELPIELPWFMFIKNDQDICTVIDPATGHEVQVKMPDFVLGSRIVGSQNGILLMQNIDTICWVNPFTGLSGQYPLNHIIDMVGIEFSTEPTSSSCVTVAVAGDAVFYINQGEGIWNRVPIINFSPHGNPIFLDEHFYFIGVNGELAIFDQDNTGGGYGLRVLERPKSPCNSFEQSFLTRCDGQLLAVFVSHIENWIRVFKLDHFTMTWIEVESLENRSLFISHSWCFFTTPKLSGMENKIFLPRFHGEKQSMVFYSLETKGFHCLDGCTDLMKGLHDSCERKNSCWIEPNWT